MILILPWPSKDLSPNSRVHWRARHRAAKAYRKACHLVTVASRFQVPDGDLALRIEFCPPDRRARDDDNLIASFKSGRDGIAEALGIDDKRFKTLASVSDEVVKGGEVRVTISSRGVGEWVQ